MIRTALETSRCFRALYHMALTIPKRNMPFMAIYCQYVIDVVNLERSSAKMLKMRRITPPIP